MISKHGKLLARTVLVRNNEVEKSFNLLNRVLQNEKILKEAKMHEYFERPCDRRNRICFERCKRIYDVEMSRKMRMLMRKNRVDPFPR